MWTGGRDPTLILYVVRGVATDTGVPVPSVVSINHFEYFDETGTFVCEWANRWRLDPIVARSEKFARPGASPGDEIPLADLGNDTRREPARFGHGDGTVALDADSFEDNHLLKTIALNDMLEARGLDGVFSDVRWDEQEFRGNEASFSPRHDSEKYPPHDHVHPILRLRETDVWAVLWEYIIPDSVESYPAGHIPASTDDLPDGVGPTDPSASPKYFESYRLLDVESGSTKSDGHPVWA